MRSLLQRVKAKSHSLYECVGYDKNEKSKIGKTKTAVCVPDHISLFILFS